LRSSKEQQDMHLQQSISYTMEGYSMGRKMRTSSSSGKATSPFGSTARGVWRQQQMHPSLPSHAQAPFTTAGTQTEFSVLMQQSSVPNTYLSAAQEQQQHSSLMPAEVSSWVDERSSNSNMLFRSSKCPVLRDVPAQSTAQYGVPTTNCCSPLKAAVHVVADANAAKGTEGGLVRELDTSVVTPVPIRFYKTLIAHDLLGTGETNDL
jgi:hypothetical protein